MRQKALTGSAKLILVIAMLLLTAGVASAVTYLPSTKYINIQTEFQELTVTLEKNAPVDFIAHCAGFASGKCPAWDIYDTAISQNATHVTFDVFDKGAYIGVRMPPEIIGKNLTQIKAFLESQRNITIMRLNSTEEGLFLEFTLPLTGIARIMQVKDAVIVIRGLQNETDLRNVQRVQLTNITYNNEEVSLQTDVVAIEASNFTQAELTIPKRGYVNMIMKCAEWDFNASSCVAWAQTSIPFSQDDNFVYFNVSSFSAYGGVELILLNVQSYPTVGDYWTVSFTTGGIANLSIEGAEGTLYGTDIEFDSLKCGETPVEVVNNENGVSVADYTCAGISYYRVKVLTTGKHTQKFTFGDIVKYARNLANSMPNIISVEGKLTNSSADNQNGPFNITFSIFSQAIGGLHLWEENVTEVEVIDGIFSVRLGETTPLNLDWNVPYFLELKVEGDDVMTPRINLTSTPYAKSADRAFNLSCTDCIDETQIDTSGNFLIEGSLNLTSNVINMHSHKIINLLDPSDLQDAATKNYVDDLLGQQGGVASGWNDTGAMVSLIGPTDNMNATTLWINNSNGRVGIGTYAPQAALHVVGSINVTGNITSGGYRIEETTDAIVISATGNKPIVLTTSRGTWT
jgi:hypothetical protein